METNTETTNNDNSATFILRDEYYGGVCSICGTASYFNYRTCNYVACHTHRILSLLGWNMLSSWKDENEEIWERNRELYESYRSIEETMEKEHEQTEHADDTQEFLVEMGDGTKSSPLPIKPRSVEQDLIAMLKSGSN